MVQAVELSQRLHTAVQIVSKHLAPDLPFLVKAGHADPTGWLSLLLIKAGEVETNRCPTTTHIVQSKKLIKLKT